MKIPKFSIILPTHNRANMLHRALNSVAAQTYPDFELVIIDDYSTDKTKDLVEEYGDERFTYIRQEERTERVVATNRGMKEATGEWLCFLDSDDMYVPYYLEMLSMAITEAPKAKIFNFGGFNVHRNYTTTLREPFRPEKKGKGHEMFRSGGIANGHFIFKRELLDEVGYLPEGMNCWLFADAFKEKFPELKPLYENQAELGNPWGQDFALAYMLTRKHYSIPLDIYLYIIWGREEKKLEI